MIRNIIVLFVLGLLTLVPSIHTTAALQPNIILILVDDLGWMDLSCQGSRYYETPNLDRLAAQGMRFTNAYAACAVCSPTRAAVQTGRYPGRLGVTDWIRSRFQGGAIPADKKNPSGFTGGKRKFLVPKNALWMESEEITIAELLEPAGYVSCHIGKWHLGADDWYPQKQGYDFNYGGCDYGQPPNYFDPFNQPKHQHAMIRAGIPHLPGRKPGQYLSDREAEEAVAFIEKHKDKPFFLNMDNYAVHTPIQAKAEVTARYEKKTKTRQKNAKYAAMVESVDDCAGRIMAALEQHGIADRTIIIFTSDNGGLLGPTNNAPLRSGKGYAYEGGIRVPLLIKWPGVVNPGTTSAEPVTSVDYFPTIAEVTGLDLPEDRDIDGLSLAKHLSSQGRQKLNRDAIFWHFPHYRHNPGPYSIIREGDWKLIKFYEGPMELFDLKNDLGETKNLAVAMPEKVKGLERRLLAHLKSVGAKMPKPNPPPKKLK
jgi:arylsulfatase A-like enzyme